MSFNNSSHPAAWSSVWWSRALLAEYVTPYCRALPWRSTSTTFQCGTIVVTEVVSAVRKWDCPLYQHSGTLKVIFTRYGVQGKSLAWKFWRPQSTIISIFALCTCTKYCRKRHLIHGEDTTHAGLNQRRRPSPSSIRHILTIFNELTYWITNYT